MLPVYQPRDAPTNIVATISSPTHLPLPSKHSSATPTTSIVRRPGAKKLSTTDSAFPRKQSAVLSSLFQHTNGHWCHQVRWSTHCANGGLHQSPRLPMSPPMPRRRARLPVKRPSFAHHLAQQPVQRLSKTSQATFSTTRRPPGGRLPSHLR